VNAPREKNSKKSFSTQTLEPLTKPETDEGTANGEKSFVNVSALLESNAQSPELV
jgi:hypothetical protein